NRQLKGTRRQSLTIQTQQYYQQEATKLRHQIQILQNANRHLAGEGLSSLTIKELKQLESRLERGIARIRSKKHELLFAEIEYMQKRELELQNDNTYLRSKNPNRAMKIKNLQKLVIKELQDLGVTGDKAQLQEMLMNKIKSSSQFVIDDKCIRLVERTEQS
ncbi:agamous-like MADS-box protein AGL11, partial [Dioscorea cayenensis subsp. rotundata]|uniref:Agamous-like MADS-box protein AGL11 n=1 Tax=Dioscorea cayennensis subsp. rotundata TaxID=55577 RepID=A0AB40CX39_DIOCR